MTTAGSGTAGRLAEGSGLARYRRDHQALAIAAEAAVGGVQAIEAALADRGWGHDFPDRIAIAALAQNEWWHQLLARVDAALDDDLAALAPAARTAAVRAAWVAQRRATLAYLQLASLGADRAEHEWTPRRYARLLALFAGTAAVTDDYDTAAEAGLTLVRDLSDS